MKPGRNDPCPCGSGKKYKHCCLAASYDTDAASSELMWRRIRRANEGLIDKMLAFTAAAYGYVAYEEAWEEFTLDIIDESPGGSPHGGAFLPWFLHHWSPDVDTEVRDSTLHGVPPTRAFLRAKGKSLDPISHRYLEACMAAPFSFHEIVECRPGIGFAAKDIFTGQVHDVLERSGSQSLRNGDVLFASLVRCEGIVLMEGSGATVIPPIHTVQILELRNDILSGGDVTPDEVLVDWDMELRTLYLDIADSILNPRMPELRNTDGDEFSPQRLVFDIDSPQEAFDALKHLSLNDDEDALLADAGRDAQGRLQRVSLGWLERGNRVHKGWDNTALGQIEIDGNRMIVDVNSEERAAKFKSIVKKALKDRARYRLTEMRSMQRALADASSDEFTDRESSAEEQDLIDSPEVRAALTEMMSQHYERWLKEKIPALHGLTPLQAAKKPATREMVAALVEQIERSGHTMCPPLDPSIPRKLRERLGLDPS